MTIDRLLFVTLGALSLGGVVNSDGVAASAPHRERAVGATVEVLVNGVPAPTYGHRGRTWVLGHTGDRYDLRITNHSDRRIEAVVSVDGRDVIDGETADFRNHRGYLVPARGHVDIDGWRISGNAVAAFRFSSVIDSYAAQTGSARDVGVIGVAVFGEKLPPRPLFVPQSRSRGDRDEPGASGAAPAAPAPRESKDDAAGQDSSANLSEADGDSAGRQEGERAKKAERRPGLGTAYGEQRHSPVQEVRFVRANPSQPDTLLALRYNNREGLRALGIDVDGRYTRDDNDLRSSADPFPASRHYVTPPPRGSYRRTPDDEAR